MIKQILIAGLLVIVLSGVGGATTLQLTDTADGFGTWVEDVEIESWYDGYWKTNIIGVNRIEYSPDNLSRIVYYKSCVDRETGYYAYHAWKRIGVSSWSSIVVLGDINYNLCTAFTNDPPAGYTDYYCAINYRTPNADRSFTGRLMLTVSSSPLDEFTVSGSICGITSTELYIKDTGDVYQLIETNTSSTFYSFDILNNSDYKLVFSDSHEYEFTCTDNIVYDRDVCSYITLNFRDNCENLLRETEFQYCNHLETITCYMCNTSSGSYDILFEDQDYLELWVSSADGILYYNISSPQDISYSVNNPTISWHNNIFVKDGNTSMILEDALVTFSQDCIINPSLYPSRNKYTNVDGYAIFDQCELDSFRVSASLTGYKPIENEYVSMIYSDAFKLGQTTILNLYPSDDPTNESDVTEGGTIATTYIYFKDNSSHYTNSILDTDEYVDLYYYNNNSESTAMTLKFQKYNVYTGLEDLLSWNIPHDTSGHKRILKANYTDYTYSYYGYLYNAEIVGWNRKTRLSVRNETKEIIDYYQNLSTVLWFENKNSEGNIDYREDISIIAYANSDNSSLLEISLELYNNSVYVDHINLTWAEFVTADTKWYYEWKPDHAYENGHNYTVRMHGYDYYLLESDYINASDYRKNKLTIIVKDREGNNLNNAYVFLEGYGSLSTGVSYYNSYEGLDNGDYRYKASKSGYAGAGWDNINLADGDEIVCYILTSDTGNTTYKPVKTSDADIQSFFFPMMFILFIFMLMGAFRYVCS